jgi:hypothetical protein
MSKNENENTAPVAETNDATATAESKAPKAKTVKVSVPKEEKKPAVKVPAKPAAKKVPAKPAKKAPAKPVAKKAPAKPAKKAPAKPAKKAPAKPAKKVPTKKKAAEIRTADNSNRDFGRYDFSGQSLPKGQVVRAVILEDSKKKGMTLSKLQERWPDEIISGPWGMIKELSAAKRLSGTKKLRYFLRDGHEINLSGKKYVVCNQISRPVFDNFLKRAKANGYTNIRASRK